MLSYELTKNNVLIKLANFGFNIIDLSNIILKNKDIEVFDGHFNEAGHKLLAESISNHF